MSKVIEMNSAIEAYLASGKKITILPPFASKEVFEISSSRAQIYPIQHWEKEDDCSQ